MKLVINSHIDYEIVRNKLFESLYKIYFTQFEDVILVLGGCGYNLEPKIKKISDVTNLQFQYGINHKITVIHVSENCYDWAGFIALNRYKNNELVKSNGYFYIPDTCTFARSFNKIFKEFKIENPRDIYSTPVPNAVVCVFGDKYIDEYKNNFDTTLTKVEGVELEMNFDIDKNGKIVKGIHQFGNVKIIGYRHFVEYADIYDTGSLRMKCLYPEFGIYKWVLWGNNGDINGNINKNAVRRLNWWKNFPTIAKEWYRDYRLGYFPLPSWSLPFELLIT